MLGKSLLGLACFSLAFTEALIFEDKLERAFREAISTLAFTFDNSNSALQLVRMKLNLPQQEIYLVKLPLRSRLINQTFFQILFDKIKPHCHFRQFASQHFRCQSKEFVLDVFKKTFGIKLIMMQLK
ncbi:MAG: hypothetical protein NZO16_04670 [Deltaproteobacteria bacterium]|nr:hypothetical protein [Deltaproteobacteria bacterium]